MAHLINSSHYSCLLAKSSVHHAKQKINSVSNLLRPSSGQIQCSVPEKEVPVNFPKNRRSLSAVLQNKREHIDMPQSQNTHLKRCGRSLSTNKVTENNYEPFKEQSLIANYENKAETNSVLDLDTKFEHEQGRNVETNHPSSFPYNKIEKTKMINMNGSKIFRKIVNTQDPLPKAELRREQYLFTGCYSDFIKLKSKDSNPLLQTSVECVKPKEFYHSSQNGLKLLSTGYNSSKLFDLQCDHYSYCIPQYMRNNYVNLRSVCGSFRTNENQKKKSYQNIPKLKKSFSKLVYNNNPNKHFRPKNIASVPTIPLMKRHVNESIKMSDEENLLGQGERADYDGRHHYRHLKKYSSGIKMVGSTHFVSSTKLPKKTFLDGRANYGKTLIVHPEQSISCLSTKLNNLPLIHSGYQTELCQTKMVPQRNRRFEKVSIDPPFRRYQKPNPTKSGQSDYYIGVTKKVFKISNSKTDTSLRKCRKKLQNTLIQASSKKNYKTTSKEILKSDGDSWSYDILNFEAKIPNFEDAFSRKEQSSYKNEDCKQNIKLKVEKTRPKKHYGSSKPCRRSSEVRFSIQKKSHNHSNVDGKVFPKLSISEHETDHSCMSEGSPIKPLPKKKVTYSQQPCDEKMPHINKKADAYSVSVINTLPLLKSNYPLPKPKTDKPMDTPFRRLPKVIMEEPPKKKCLEPKADCYKLNYHQKVIRKQLAPLRNTSPPRTFISLKNSPRLERLKPKKRVQKRICDTEFIENSCLRRDENDEISSSDRKDYDSKHIQSVHSMSTNLLRHSDSSLLKRNMQSYHIDMRKRFSFLSFKDNKTHNKFFDRKSDIHSSCLILSERDSSMQREVQPKYPLYSKFKGVEPMRPEAPVLNPELEDECIREKCNLPNQGVTSSCDNPNAKRKYLRVSKGENSPCPAKVGIEYPTVIKTCDDSTPICPPLFSPKSPPVTEPCPQQIKSCETLSQVPTSTRKVSPCPKFKIPYTKSPSFWQRLKNYFKARPNCPTPADYKRKKIILKAQQLADRAGLALYDPHGDPQQICKEVHRRCCLARKIGCRTDKKRMHTYQVLRNYSTLVPRPLICDSLLDVTGMNWRIFDGLTSNRKLSSWRKPFDFYTAVDDRLENMNSTQLESHISQTNYQSLYCLKKLGAIDMDVMLENMYRSLWIFTELNPIENEDKENHNYMLECTFKNLDLRSDIVSEILKKLSETFEYILKNKKLNMDDFDATRKTLEVIEQILRMKSGI